MKRTVITLIASAMLPALCATAQNMTPFQSGKAWGYKDAGGNIIVEAAYAAASLAADGYGLVAVQEGNALKWGVVGQDGRTVIEPVYDYIDLYSEGMVAVYRGPVYSSDEGLYMSGGQWGYIDLASPAEEFKVIFDLVGPFTDSVAWVNCVRTDSRRQKRTMPIVDKKGKPVGEEIIFGVSASFTMNDLYLPGSDGSVTVPDGAWVLMNRKGNALTSTDSPYQAVGEFKDGLAWVKRNGRFGFVNIHGEEVIPVIYSMVQDAPGSRPGSLLLHPESGAVRWVVNDSGQRAWFNEKGETVIGFTDFEGKVSVFDTVDENMWDY